MNPQGIVNFVRRGARLERAAFLSLVIAQAAQCEADI
jgi:hypothetical protein